MYESAVSIRYTDVSYDGAEEQNADSDKSLVSINEAKFNVQHVCLVLESIGVFSLVLKESFKPYLMKTLHRVMEKTGSGNYCVHLAGATALQNIRAAFNYDDVQQLIHDNSDYIAYYVNASIKKVRNFGFYQ